MGDFECTHTTDTVHNTKGLLLLLSILNGKRLCIKSCAFRMQLHVYMFVWLCVLCWEEKSRTSTFLTVWRLCSAQIWPQLLCDCFNGLSTSSYTSTLTIDLIPLHYRIVRLTKDFVLQKQITPCESCCGLAGRVSCWISPLLSYAKAYLDRMYRVSLCVCSLLPFKFTFHTIYHIKYQRNNCWQRIPCVCSRTWWIKQMPVLILMWSIWCKSNAIILLHWPLKVKEPKGPFRNKPQLDSCKPWGEKNIN